MMRDVPKADVVVTNPTHFAIALKYDPSDQAPRVLAKGQDEVALMIKEIALEHKIPTVENKPLAHALYKNVAIGDEIPPSLYEAVAQVLAFVYRTYHHRHRRKRVGGSVSANA
jgi:flagellar biosynthetic protein FlhB